VILWKHPQREQTLLEFPDFLTGRLTPSTKIGGIRSLKGIWGVAKRSMLKLLVDEVHRLANLLFLRKSIWAMMRQLSALLRRQMKATSGYFPLARLPLDNDGPQSARDGWTFVATTTSCRSCRNH